MFGKLPELIATNEDVTLETKDIAISNINNANVKLISQAGEKITFKSLSGSYELFKYDIVVSKEGFTESKTMQATVTPMNCPTSMIAGTWRCQDYHHDSNHPDGFSASPNYWEIIIYEDKSMTLRSSNESTLTNRNYSLFFCTFSYDFFGCNHSFKFIEGTFVYNVNGCGGFHHHVYTKM